jgi:CRISPR-associated endonuclease Cas1
MNALLLEKLTIFRETHGLGTAKVLIAQKVRYQFAVIGKKGMAKVFLEQITNAETVNILLLTEARAAKAYWGTYGKQITSRVSWYSRKPHAPDPCNQLLDIGYHFITGWFVKLFAELNIPTEFGIFHRAQSAQAHPLVYDFMEWLRPILVDKIIYLFFRKKKKMISNISEKDIGRTVSMIKKALERRYYHKKLGYCITLAYWIKLAIFELEKSIRHNEPFNPIFPRLRHETRCKKITPRKARGDER